MSREMVLVASGKWRRSSSRGDTADPLFGRIFGVVVSLLYDRAALDGGREWSTCVVFALRQDLSENVSCEADVFF